MTIFEILSVVSICLNMFLLGQVYRQNIAIKKIIGVFAIVGTIIEQAEQREKMNKLTGKDNEE